MCVQDSFYKSLSPEEHAKAHANQYDFDCPDALDFDVMVQTLKDLKRGYSLSIIPDAPLFCNPADGRSDE